MPTPFKDRVVIVVDQLSSRIPVVVPDSYGANAYSEWKTVTTSNTQNLDETRHAFLSQR